MSSTSLHSGRRVLSVEFDHHDHACLFAHGVDESVWAWIERRYPKATKRAAKERHWREFVIAMREFYGDETRLL